MNTNTAMVASMQIDDIRKRTDSIDITITAEKDLIKNTDNKLQETKETEITRNTFPLTDGTGGSN